MTVVQLWIEKISFSNMEVKLEPGIQQTKNRFSKWILQGISRMAKRHPYCLRFGINRIGKSKSLECWMKSALVSKNHCKIIVHDNEIILHDESSNGTYVNNFRCLKSSHVLCDGDSICFGTHERSYDHNDSKIYFYKLHLMAENESISLIDDEDDVNVKTEQNDASVLTETEQESLDDQHDTDEFRLNYDFDLSECTSQIESTNVIQNCILPVSILENIRVDIKEEISWNAYEYEKQLRPNEEPKLVETVDLCDFDSTANDEPVESIQKRENKRKRIDNDVVYPSVMLPLPLNVIKKQKQMSETEKNLLVSAVTLNQKLLKTKAHVTVQSRAQKLALNMLGIDQPRTSQKISASASTASNISKSAETQNIKIQLDESILCDLTKQENDFITEITEWNTQWLVEERIDAPVADKKYSSINIPCKFDFVQEYIEYMTSFLKIELWQSILATSVIKNPEQANFCTLLTVKTVKRNNDTRIVCICETETLISSEQKIFKDNLVLVKHTQGRFFGFVTEVKYTKIGESNVRISFHIEVTSKLERKHLNISKIKNISVKSIFCIRTELDIFSAISTISSTYLCSAVLHPWMEEDSVWTGNVSSTTLYKMLSEKCKKILLEDQKSIYAIEGAFGTGKTTLLINTVLSIVEETELNSKRIVICGASDISLDIIALSIYRKYQKIVRFGALDKMSKSVHQMSVHHSTKNQEDVLKIDRANIVLTTPNLALKLSRLSSKAFQICFLDDCSLLSEAIVLPILHLKIKILVLFGDRKISSTHVVGSTSRDRGFGRPLFNRIIEAIGPSYTKYIPVMKTQHRMRMDIFSWPNFHFYDNEILPSLHPLAKTCPFRPYMVFNFKQDRNEVMIIEQIVNACMKYTKNQHFTYGIIPCFSQTRNELIKSKISKNVSISTHDCFKGDQRDIIIITAIKSKEFEFPATLTMINVALTRARYSLFFCGNFSVLQNLPVWKSFLRDSQIRNCLINIEYDKFNQDEFIQNILQ